MPRRRSVFVRFGLWVAIIVGCVIAATIVYVRDVAGGMKNALSRAYWQERAKGYDEYEPEFAWFRRGPRDRKEVCLTFDDGPHGKCTVEELDVLRQENVRATFFVVGKKMLEHPDLIRRMIAEGHEVGNHTMTHPMLSSIPLSSVRKELELCEAGFERITGRRMGLFRPPHMRDNKAILSLAKSMGYQTVDYNVGAHDFMVSKNDPKVTPEMIAKLRATPDQIADRVIANIKDGAIILLHDQDHTAEAIPKIIRTLRAEGYSFVTVSEALAHIQNPVEVVANPPARELHLAVHKSDSKLPLILNASATVH